MQKTKKAKTGTKKKGRAIVEEGRTKARVGMTERALAFSATLK